MSSKKQLTTKKIALVGVLAALTCVASAIRIKVPSIVGTSAFHLGNILCALSGILLGPWLGGLAAGLGSALHDILFDPAYISDCWLTFLMKFVYGLMAGLVIRCGRKDWAYAKALLATITGALSYALLYFAKTFFYSGLLIKGLTPAAALLAVEAKIPATMFNVVVAVIAAPLLAVALQKSLKRSRLLP